MLGEDIVGSDAGLIEIDFRGTYLLLIIAKFGDVPTFQFLFTYLYF